MKPSEVIVYWTHVSSNALAQYKVHVARSVTDGENVQERTVPVPADTNFEIIKDLDVGPEYTFQVSGSFVVNSSFVEGPLSVVTQDTRVQTAVVEPGFTMKDASTVVFGLLLLMSLTVNVVLLLVNVVLLGRFRYTTKHGVVVL